MGTISRQNTLFVSEDWIKIYEAIENVDFRAYDIDNLTQAIMNYLRTNYPEEFNEWLASSEFVTKVEILAWLSQNISFRVDLNTRENFLATAERRDSLIRLAQNVAYKINRVRGASGKVRIESIRTNQQIFDSNGQNIQDKDIVWNDPQNVDWFEQFLLIMNSAFATRTQYGKPLVKYVSGATRAEQYVFKSVIPSTGTYKFTAAVNGVSLPFEVINARLDKDDGTYQEIMPETRTSFNCFYEQDGRGLASTGTGFFFQIRQGTLTSLDKEYTEPQVLRVEELNSQNINNDDFYLQQLDPQGEVSADWELVDNVFGESVAFNTLDSEQRQVFELDTLTNDRVRVRFGDGTFGQIPLGRFRFWYRTSNPEPLIVRTEDIQNQTIAVPYTGDDTAVYFLTITFSLKESIVNAAATETNFDIRTRANRVFYTQNRMVTGQDWNNFYLRDNAIAKVKTVNRTYSGHSRYSRLFDPTGLYQNVKVLADDGRYYEEDTLAIQFQSADTNLLPRNELINNYIRPLLQKADKELLYYNKYSELFFPDETYWSETSTVAGQSLGNIVDDTATPIAVGPGATGNFVFVKTDAVLRYDTSNGPLTYIGRVIDDGTAENGIILNELIPDGVRMASVFPAFRNTLTDSEVSAIEGKIDLKLGFGLSWDRENEEWLILDFEDLDLTGEFSLDNQNDKTKSQLDASWMVYLQFIPGGVDEDQWKIVDRGLGQFFESAREVQFYFANNERSLDPETGAVVNDRVKILECNESRTSLRRRGFESEIGATCDIGATTFVGDGVKECFQTEINPLPTNTVVNVDGIIQRLNVDYTITQDPAGDFICFLVAPADGALIDVVVSSEFVAAEIGVFYFAGNGSDTEFPLTGVDVQAPTNAFVFIDGVEQRLTFDYSFVMIDGTPNLVFNACTPPGAGTNIIVYSYHGIDNPAIGLETYVGTGFQTSYEFTAVTQNADSIIVFWDGVLQDPNTYTLTPGTSSTPNIVDFATAPGIGVDVRIYYFTNPSLTSSGYSSHIASGGDTDFALTGFSGVTANMVYVFLDGVNQEGPWSPNGTWSIIDGDTVRFSTPPAGGVRVTLWVVASMIGSLSTQEPTQVGSSTVANDLNISSCLVSFIGSDASLFVEDIVRDDGGYTNARALFTVPSDEDNSGFYDNPFLFRDLVVTDGFTDLVLWRRVEEQGFSVWEPIDGTTIPKGTYGLSQRGDPKDGDFLGGVKDQQCFSGNGTDTDFESGVDSFDCTTALADTTGISLIDETYTVSVDGVAQVEGTDFTVSPGTTGSIISFTTPPATGTLNIELRVFNDLPVADGDVHYDITTDTWVVANTISGKWEAASNQGEYKKAIGRSGLKFSWEHYSPDAHRIDPSVSNIKDVYLLTTTYDEAYRTWLANNGAAEDEPVAPTSEALRTQFADFEDFRMISDAIIYHTARYKPLFGTQAVDELQATFKIVQTPGSTLSDNDIRLGTLNAINAYFDVTNWEFGESFYFTELAAYIHQQLAPDVQSVVIVPKFQDQAFGRLFQVRAEPDELLVSAASATDIELVTNLSDEELRIGSLG